MESMGGLGNLGMRIVTKNLLYLIPLEPDRFTEGNHLNLESSSLRVEICLMAQGYTVIRKFSNFK